MAHTAIGELFGVNVVFPDQFFAEHKLVGCVPSQIKNFVARTNKLFRRAVAIETPFHVKRMRFPRQRHLIQLAVTRRAADAVVDVNAVVEENEVRRVIDALPFQAPIIRHAFTDWCEHRRVLPDLRMAGHACFRRRHSGEGGLFHGRVAKAAIESKSINVVFVAEWNGLWNRCHLTSRPRGPINGVQNQTARARQKNSGNDARSDN